MKNFTIGPVDSPQSVLEVSKESSPYFRTPEFSDVMKENEYLFRQLVNASDNSRVVFLTGSGTAAMEAAVMNLLTSKDKALVVNSGSFGQRFADICKIHNIPYSEVFPKKGKSITSEDLSPFHGQDYSALLVNIHETSTGVLHNSNVIRDFVKENDLILIVDAISSFLADPLNMSEIGANVVITGSQKALACQPGISILALDETACKIIESNNVQSMYFNLKDYLKDGERGQTPFTPAVTILLQINKRMKDIIKNGGIDSEVLKTKELANDFRKKIESLPIDIEADSLSNAVTPIFTRTFPAEIIIDKLKSDYGIWVCPNGGVRSHSSFRVGHLGDLSIKDNTLLVEALRDILSENDN